MAHSEKDTAKELINEVRGEIGEKQAAPAVEENLNPETRRQRWLLALVGLLVVVWLIAYAGFYRAPSLSTDELEEYVRLELHLAASELAEYYQENREYPETLSQLALAESETEGWQYSRTAPDQYVIRYSYDGVSGQYDSTSPMSELLEPQ